MKDFIDYLKKEKLVEKLIEYYRRNLQSEKDRDSVKEVVEQLFNSDEFKENIPESKEINNSDSNLDLIGKIYEKSLKYEVRKRLGEFYTPSFAVDYILNAVGYNSESHIDDKKLIDISCGSGSFIIQSINILINQLKQNLDKPNLNDLSLNKGKDLILKVKENIYGVDINPIACILCQINIHNCLFKIYKLIKEQEKEYQLPFFQVYNLNALILPQSKFPIDFHRQKFDYVVGNPPYIFIRDIPSEIRAIIESGDFETNIGQYDYYQLFIELGIRLLKNSGYLGYIVPDSLLVLSNRAVIRNYIKNNTKIKEIYHTGPRFDDPIVSNIILILQKERAKKDRDENVINISIPTSKYSSPKMIQQNTLEKWDYKFLINLNDTDIAILNILNHKFPKLEDLMRNEGFKISLSRGVELSKNGMIIYCDTCKKYFPLPKKKLKCRECKNLLNQNTIENIIQDNIPEKLKEEFKPFLYSINRYQIKEYKNINIKKKGINYKDLNSYEDRIIIRQLSQNNFICAAYDKGLSITSQSFYNLKIRQSPVREFNHYYLLGLINSQLLSYFFIKSFGSYKKLFPRILIEKIKNLPIKIPDSIEERKIASDIVKKVKLISGNDVNRDALESEIDVLVYKIYQISKLNKKYISNFMKNLI